jgi:hypothetical protein
MIKKKQTHQNLNPIKSTPSRLNEKNGFFENIERVLNPDNSIKTNAINVSSHKQSLDHSLYWKNGLINIFWLQN